MSDFLSVVAIYYWCEAMAQARHLTMSETMHCSRTRDTVHSYFVTEFELAPRGTAARAAQMRQGQHGFDTWAAANPDRVEQMQAEAWLIVRGLSAVRG